MDRTLFLRSNAAPHSAHSRLATVIATLGMVALIAGMIVGARHFSSAWPALSDDPTAILFATG